MLPLGSRLEHERDDWRRDRAGFVIVVND